MKHYLGDEIKKNEIDRNLNICGEERCSQDFGGKTYEKETTLNTQA
jgi:hypothetical protein